MSGISLDLTIERMLADPMIAAVMRADRIDPHDLAQLLRAASLRFKGARGAEAPPGETDRVDPQALRAARGRWTPGEPCLACA
jgi:hypothetical protein